MAANRYDGPDVNAPQIVSLYGDFTCDEDPSDCDRMRHPPLSGADVGGYASTSNQLFVHFTTRELAHPSVAFGAEGWLMTWLHSGGGSDCDLSGDWGDSSTPAFASIGTCNVDSLRTGATCRFHCEGGLMPSSEADPAVWRTIRSFGMSLRIISSQCNSENRHFTAGVCLCLHPCQDHLLLPIHCAGTVK